MLRGQDVVILLQLAGKMAGASVRDLAESVGFDLAGTHRSVKRLGEAGLYLPERKLVMLTATEEFLVSAVKFAFPAQRGSETRGVPTAWAAPPLVSQFAPTTELPPVWPHPDGDVRGIAFKPLHSIAVGSSLRDGGLWERLALIDALRGGDARARRLAKPLLIDRLRHP